MGIARVEGDGSFQLLFSRLVLLRPQQREAQLVTDIVVIRINSRSGRQMADRGIVSLLVDLEDA